MSIARAIIFPCAMSLYLVALLLVLQVAEGRPLPPSRLQCEYNHVGLSQEQLTRLSRQILFATDKTSPSLSWSVSHSARGALVTASRVLVATDSNLNALLWDTGPIPGNATSIQYSGPALSSGKLYFWKVSWRDGEGRWSEWSEETGHFVTGVLRMTVWNTAKWIAAPSTITNAPHFSKQFLIDSNQLASAVLYISGLGFFKLYVNGKDINAYSDPSIALTPGWTNYEVRVPYSVYTITSQAVQSNILTIEVILGTAWRETSQFNPKDPSPPHPDSVERVLRAILNVTYINSTSFSYATDDSWECAPSVFTNDSIYNGETLDLSKGPVSPTKAVITNGPNGIMYLPPIPPIVEVGSEEVVAIYALYSDYTIQIVEFGNNSAGGCVVNVQDIKAGESITLHHAEVKLHPPYGPMNGSLYYDNLRSALQMDTFISNGNTSIYYPSFTYHGFRYVEVSNYPRALSASDIQKVVIGTNLQRNAQLQTSIPLLKSIQDNCVRGQLSNLMSVPTDCCQRDERLGWMGDAGLSSDSMALNFHTNSFHSHFAQLIADELINGSLPDVVPFYRYGTRPADPTWGAAFPQIIWVLFHYYGDLNVVQQFFPLLTQYLDFMTSQVDKSGIGQLYGYYGDWVPPTPYPKVNISFTSAFSYLHNIQQAHEMAVAINDSANALKFMKLFQEQSTAFNKAFLNKYQYLNALQVTYVLPLYLGIVPTDVESLLVNEFLNQLADSDELHITAGIVGTKFILPVLTQLKEHDIALEIVQQTSYPSWGFMIHNKYEPATTVWELWNSWNGSASMDSRNHHMFSSVSGWMITDMVGLQLPKGSFGFQNIHFHPARFLGLSEAAVTLDSPKPVRLSWKRSGGIQCGRVAEDQSSHHPGLPRHGGLYLSCGKNRIVIKVLFASFGNPTGHCGYHQKGTCHAVNSLEGVEKLCLGYNDCLIPSDVDFWEDPCPSNDSKWLIVSVQCGVKIGGIGDYKYSHLNVEVGIPVGSRGIVFLPAHGKSQLQVWEGGEVIWKQGKLVGGGMVGLQSWRWIREDDSLAIELSSGNYNFTVIGEPPEEKKWVESNGGWVNVECGDGRVVSTVDWASFGDSFLRWVGQEAETVRGSCHAGCSQHAVERACLGKQRCKIPSTAEFFGGSACRNGRLIVAYTCNKRP